MSLYANFSSGSSVKQMLKFAKWDENVDKEGLGIIFEADNKLQFLKSAHSLSEVMSGKLSGDRALRFKKIGSIGYKMVDKTYYKQLNKKFVDIAKFITGIRSTFLLLFLDRYKVNTLNRADLLPMKIEDYLVIHDGENKNVNLIKKYLGYGILSQAGVAIGLSLSVKHDFQGLGSVLHTTNGIPFTEGDHISAAVLATITATSILFGIIGPILTKYSLIKANEIKSTGT